MLVKDLREKFKNQILSNGVLLPGAYNALTAMQIEQTGFEGAYISGAALSASAGLPDIGLLTLRNMLIAHKAEVVCSIHVRPVPLRW